MCAETDQHTHCAHDRHHEPRTARSALWSLGLRPRASLTRSLSDSEWHDDSSDDASATSWVDTDVDREPGRRGKSPARSGGSSQDLSRTRTSDGGACQPEWEVHWELLSKRRRDGPPGGRTASASTWHTGTLSPRVGHSGEKARFGHLTGFKVLEVRSSGPEGQGPGAFKFGASEGPSPTGNLDVTVPGMHCQWHQWQTLKLPASVRISENCEARSPRDTRALA
jgi:hypothetical protein